MENYKYKVYAHPKYLTEKKCIDVLHKQHRQKYGQMIDLYKHRSPTFNYCIDPILENICEISNIKMTRLNVN